MLNVARLIKKSPYKALIDIVNYNNRTRIGYGYVDFINLRSLSGRRTEITIKAKQFPGYPAEYINEKTFRYNRLHIDTFLQTVDKTVGLVLPATTESVIAAFIAKYEIFLEPSDFIIENIPVGVFSYRLRANPSSLRWVGDTFITIVDPDDDIKEYFYDNVLNGLNDVGQDIVSIFANNHLDFEHPTITTTNFSTVFTNTQLNGYWLGSGPSYTEPIGVTNTPRTMFHKAVLTRTASPIGVGSYVINALVPITGTRNTRATIQGNPIAGYVGTIDLDYNRFNLNTYFGTTTININANATQLSLNTTGLTRLVGAPTTIDRNGATTPTALFDLVTRLINQSHAIEFDPSEIDVVYNTANTTWTLTAKSTSLVWYGVLTIKLNQ